jgi:hypothetical protein
MSRARTHLSWLTIAIPIIVAAWLSLDKIQNGNVYLIRLPFDRQPSDREIQEAAEAARLWKLPALMFLSLSSIALSSTVKAGPLEAIGILRQRLAELLRGRAVLCTLFAGACLADFLSTWWYFHEYGMEDELHPGIKLVTYAWGPSAGCLAAKSIQAGLMLLVCVLFPRIAGIALAITTVAYSCAAIWNLGFI